MRASIFLSVVITLVFAIGVPSPAQAENLSKPFKIGAILPLSGQGASLGAYLRDGITLAHESFPVDMRSKVQLFIEDDSWQPARSVSAFQKLVDTEKVNAILCVGSAIGNALAPLAERKHIPLVAIGASDHNLAKGKKFAFIHWVTPETEASTMVKEVVRRGYKKIALITTEHEGFIALYNAIISAMDQAKIRDRIVLDERYLSSETDFRTFIAKARTKELDALVIGLFPGVLSSFTKQYRASGLPGDFIGLEIFEDENEVKASEGTLLNQWYVNADSPSLDFETNYKKRFGTHPGWAAANAFDSVKLLVEGAKLGDGNSETLVGYLNSLKEYVGAAGIYSATGDNRFTLPATIKVVGETGFKKLAG